MSMRVQDIAPGEPAGGETGFGQIVNHQRVSSSSMPARLATPACAARVVCFPLIGIVLFRLATSDSS